MKFDRRRPMERPRLSFATLARAAIEKHLPETRGPEAAWSLGPNAVWVRWPVEGSLFAYLGINRHLNWVSGEAGIARAPLELGVLHPLPGAPSQPVEGYRVRLGHLMEDQDRWWPAGPGESQLIERLEWLALQLRVKGQAYLGRFLEPVRTES
jgi:hypothetical protein